MEPVLTLTLTLTPTLTLTFNPNPDPDPNAIVHRVSSNQKGAFWKQAALVGKQRCWVIVQIGILLWLLLSIGFIDILFQKLVFFSKSFLLISCSTCFPPFP